MRRVLLLFSFLVILVTAAPASAGTSEVCDGFVRAKGKKWSYQGTRVGCDFMHQATKDFLRDRVQPEGWKCTRVRKQGVCEQKKGGDGVFVFYVKRKGLPG